jgi:hypothetical protein
MNYLYSRKNMRIITVSLIIASVAQSSAAQYAVTGNLGSHCWGGPGIANAQFDFTINPQPTAETGLSHVDITFSKPVTVVTQWNTGGSSANGNTWSWDMLDDQPRTGAILQFSNINCVNSQLSEPITFNIKQTTAGPTTTSASANAAVPSMSPCPA